MKMRGEEMGRDERMGTRGKENRREGNRGRGKDGELREEKFN